MATERFQIASGSRSTLRFGIGLAGLLLIIPIGFALFALPHGPVTFTTSTEGLRITGDVYGRMIRRDDLDLSTARRLDLDAEPAYRLVRRTNGTALPGYQSGWFATRGAGKVLVFVSDWSHAVVVPTKLGYAVIVAPVEPDTLLDQLKNRFTPSDWEHPLYVADALEPGVPPGVGSLRVWLVVPSLLVSALLVWICVRSRKVVFELSDDSMRIRGDLYGRTIPRESLRLDEARLINIKDGPDRLRLIRTNGVGLPGYQSGWHRAIGVSGNFLLFVSDRSRVVKIPTGLGYTLLLSPAAPDSFLRAIGAVETQPRP